MFFFVQGNIIIICQTFFAKALEWGPHSLAFSIFSLYVVCLPPLFPYTLRFE